MKRLIYFVLFLWISNLTGLSAQETAVDKGIQFHQNESWEQILALAKKENKLIFMDCYTSWCGPCKALAKNIFPQEKVGNFFNPRFINVQYDMEKGDGKVLREKYKKYIIGFPTLLLIDKHGNVVHQMAGYKEADELIEAIKNGAEGKDLFTLRKKYQEGERSFEFIRTYIDCLKDAFMRDTITAVTDAYFAQMDLKELDKDTVWNVLGEYITNVDSPAFDYLVRNADRYYYRLHRDRYKINRQLEAALQKAANKITRITFNEEGQPLPLNQDTTLQEKIIRYLSMASLRKLNETRAKFYIHNLLVEGNYTQAWDYIQHCAAMEITGFYPLNIHNYIQYIVAQHPDKKLLKAFLETLNSYEFQQQEKDMNFSYHMYKTLSEINSLLGNKKLAQEQLQKFETINAEKLQEYNKLLNK